MNGVRTGGTAGFPRASNRMRGARAMPASPSPSLRPTPLGLANTHISRPQEVNPKGIPSLSPGLRAASYPGCEASKDSRTLKGLKHPPRPTEARQEPAPRYNPCRVEPASATPSKVARGSQPWAGGHNPFGIGVAGEGLVGDGMSSHLRSRFQPQTCCGSIPHVPLIPFELMSPQQSPEFILKAQLAVVLLLSGNVDRTSV